VPWKTSYDVNAATPIFQDGYLFVSSGYNHGCMMLQITPTGGRKLWENKNIQCKFQPPVLDKGFRSISFTYFGFRRVVHSEAATRPQRTPVISTERRFSLWKDISRSEQLHGRRDLEQTPVGTERRDHLDPDRQAVGGLAGR